METKGIEHPSSTLSKTPISREASAKSGALHARNDPQDPELAYLTNRWPTLHPALKSQIMAIVRPGQHPTDDGGDYE
jgi:hypothetical protein